MLSNYQPIQYRPLTIHQLKNLEKSIAEFISLSTTVPLSYKIVQGKIPKNEAETRSTTVHGGYPHYLLINGKHEQGTIENTTLFFEQLATYFEEHELGYVWLKEDKHHPQTLLTIGFWRM